MASPSAGSRNWVGFEGGNDDRPGLFHKDGLDFGLGGSSSSKFEENFGQSWDNAPIAGSSPNYLGRQPATNDSWRVRQQRWNPLENIGRHWNDVTEKGTSGTQGFSALAGEIERSRPMPGLAKPSTLMRHGTFEREFSKADDFLRLASNRIMNDRPVQATQKKPMATEGLRQVEMISLMADGSLGFIVKDMVIAEINDPQASACGWALGDRILCVNGVPISTMQELSRELDKAVQGFRSSSRPLIFDIWRHSVALQPAFTNRHTIQVAPAQTPPMAARAASVALSVATATPPRANQRTIEVVPVVVSAACRGATSPSNMPAALSTAPPVAVPPAAAAATAAAAGAGAAAAPSRALSHPSRSIIDVPVETLAPTAPRVPLQQATPAVVGVAPTPIAAPAVASAAAASVASAASATAAASPPQPPQPQLGRGAAALPTTSFLIGSAPTQQQQQQLLQLQPQSGSNSLVQGQRHAYGPDGMPVDAATQESPKHPTYIGAQQTHHATIAGGLHGMGLLTLPKDGRLAC